MVAAAVTQQITTLLQAQRTELAAEASTRERAAAAAAEATRALQEQLVALQDGFRQLTAQDTPPMEDGSSDRG